jgi:tetratricopeptide (TPR) repeat protein
MMTKNCPNCRATAALDARFCRQCGAPLRTETATENSVSPLASTIPLKDANDVRPTGNFPPTTTGNDTGNLDRDPRHTPQTARVDSTELNDMLNRAPNTKGFDPEATVRMDSSSAALPTSALASPPPPTGPVDFGKTMPSLTPYDTTGGAPPPSPPPHNFQSTPQSQASGMTSVPHVGGMSPYQTDPDVVTVVSPQASAPVGTAAPPAPVARAGKRSVWLLALAAAIPLLLMAVVAVWLVTRSNTGNAPTNETTTATPTPAPPDARDLANQRLIEAESLLSAGDTGGAIARLREAVGLDSSNAEAHRRLGDVLMQTGARAEAIESYRMATAVNPDSAALWRTLASAQFDEARYPDAIESYRRAFALDETNNVPVEDNARLRYADALRLDNRIDEARTVYQQLASSTQPETVQAVRERLAALASASPQPTRPGATPTPRSSVDDRAALDANRQTPTPTPNVTPTPNSTPTPRPPSTPAERYERGVQLWSSNRAAALNEFRAAGTPDARYYLGLNYVEGRNIQSLNQAALIAALGHFSAARGGRFSAQAARYHQQLTAEFDRRRGTGR